MARTCHAGGPQDRRRIPEEAIAELKKNCSILELCRARGIHLERHGRGDFVGPCPFHEENEPSFVVTPKKNLFHCLGCGAAGSVIDLVMKFDGLEFREAAEKLLGAGGLLRFGSSLEPRDERPTCPPDCEAGGAKVPPEKLAAPSARAAQHLDRVVDLYAKCFGEADEGKQYLDGRGICDAGLFTQHRVGFANGTLVKILPRNGQLKDELKALGVLLDGGRERFEGCVVFPVFDDDGNLVTICGRHTTSRKHIFLPDRPKGLWNEAAAKTYPDLILVESVIDALSVMVAGHPNVIALHGTNPSADALDRLGAYGVQSLALVLDGDQAGREAARRLNERMPCACGVKLLPDGHDPNSYLTAHGAERLNDFLTGDAEGRKQPTRAGVAEGPPASPIYAAPSGTLTLGRRRYQVHGLEKGSRKPFGTAQGLRLKATVRVEHAGRLHVDTLDLYSARSRRTLAQDLCRIFEETPETIEADITKLLRHCEAMPETTKPETGDRKPELRLSPQEEEEAEAFGRRPDLVDAILADIEARGLVGEEANKLLSYLAVTSRKMDEPLSVLVLSSSGAGKTALQDAALAFCPPEDVVKLTSLSSKALFYKEEMSLKHKVLALEEGAGAEEASYAIRNLISSGQLIVEAAIKDPATGKITTMTNKVEGPTCVLLTTTNPETDPETKSRFFVTSIDESREQTRAILAFQRKRETLDGLAGNTRLDAVTKKHHNFQRLLKPVRVINPLGKDLDYGDDRLQGRRDQPKYLRLIRAVAFLRQMQKQTKAHQVNGSAVEYIEADRDDLRLANQLAHEILGGSLDELSRPSRDLLFELEKMVRERTDGDGNEEAEPLGRLSFTRREIREFTGWSNYRVHTHLRELIEFEYLAAEIDRPTNGHRYRLLWDGQGKDGSKFAAGLKEVCS